MLRTARSAQAWQVVLCVALTTLAGCHPPPREPLPITYTVKAWQHRPEDAALIAWSQIAIEQNIDCPLSVSEARALRGYQGEARVAKVARAISCMCDVKVDLQVRYACDPRWYPSPGENPLDEPAASRLVEWHASVLTKIEGGAAPTALSRREDLDSVIRAELDARAIEPDRDAENWRDFAAAIGRFEQSATGGFYCSLQPSIDLAAHHLEWYERLDLRGRQSQPGREMLDAARRAATPHRAAMRACERLERDPRYQRLDAARDRAEQRLERERKIDGASRFEADCLSDGPDHSERCRAARALDRIEAQIGALGRTTGVRK